LSKKLTIQQLIIFITATTAVLVMLILAFFYFLDINYSNGIVLFSSIVVSIFVIYCTVAFLLKKFVVEKIGLIYNFIHDARLKNLKLKKKPLDITSFEDVEHDVIQWAEDTEKQIQSLRSLEEYRKNFVGNVSHELKTPIFSIQGYLHTLLEGGIYDEQINIKYLERAAQNADRLQNIVEDLESISKLESGNLELTISKFDIRSLVNDVFQDLNITALESNITLCLKKDADFAYLVEGDKEMIRQVLINLITNSIKYGIEKGETEVAFYDMETNILIEISDNGIGIENKHVNHLFDRFYRVDPSRSRRIGGSGLGLSIVKHIVEGHKQTIKVNSNLGEGSTFSFTLNKA
jgi:two-component system phosphate regulon sensor histidine kinase PhoR